MFFDKNYTTICASKYFGEDDIRRLHEKGIFHFGENKVQDFIKKFEGLRDLNLTWHFIGHLQSNKVKDIVDKVDYIHTIDRMSVVKEIEKHAKHKIKCFIQLNLTREPQKSGVYLENLDQFLEEIKKYDKIELVGFMTMGKDEDKVLTEDAFKSLDALARTYNLPFRSMGMSDDYELAIKHHATHLRIGRKFKELLT